MKPLLRLPLVYGSVSGLLAAAMLMGLYFMGRHPFLIPVYLDFRIFFFGVVIYFMLRDLRDRHYDAVFYFWQGLFASFVFTASFALVSSSAVALIGYAMPRFVADYISSSVQQLKSLPAEVIDRIGKDVFQRNLESLPSTNAMDLAALYFVQCFLIGIFISIILSVIVRKLPNPK